MFFPSFVRQRRWHDHRSDVTNDHVPIVYLLFTLLETLNLSQSSYFYRSACTTKQCGLIKIKTYLCKPRINQSLTLWVWNSSNCNSDWMCLQSAHWFPKLVCDLLKQQTKLFILQGNILLWWWGDKLIHNTGIKLSLIFQQLQKPVTREGSVSWVIFYLIYNNWLKLAIWAQLFQRRSLHLFLGWSGQEQFHCGWRWECSPGEPTQNDIHDANVHWSICWQMRDQTEQQFVWIIPKRLHCSLMSSIYLSFPIHSPIPRKANTIIPEYMYLP